MKDVLMTNDKSLIGLWKLRNGRYKGGYSEGAKDRDRWCTVAWLLSSYASLWLARKKEQLNLSGWRKLPRCPGIGIMLSDLYPLDGQICNIHSPPTLVGRVDLVRN